MKKSLKNAFSFSFDSCSYLKKLKFRKNAFLQPKKSHKQPKKSQNNLNQLKTASIEIFEYSGMYVYVSVRVPRSTQDVDQS